MHRVFVEQELSIHMSIASHRHVPGLVINTRITIFVLCNCSSNKNSNAGMKMLSRTGRILKFV
jgi:hypothetical protein